MSLPILHPPSPFFCLTLPPLSPLSPFHQSGLLGAILVTGADVPVDASGRPAGVDREFIAVFQQIDENASWYAEANRLTYAPTADADDADYINSNLMNSINGLMYNNVGEDNLEMRTGETVRLSPLLSVFWGEKGGRRGCDQTRVLLV